MHIRKEPMDREHAARLLSSQLHPLSQWVNTESAIACLSAQVSSVEACAMCAMCVPNVTNADPIEFTADASARTQKADPEANIQQSSQIWGCRRPQRMICSSSFMPDDSLTFSVPPRSSPGLHSPLVSAAARDDSLAPDPLHADASNLTRRLFSPAGQIQPT